MWYVYVLVSLIRNCIYVGMTEDPDARIGRHQSGWEQTTRPYRPFGILLIEEFPSRVDARRREIYLKSGVGKEYLRSLRKLKFGS